MSEIDSIPPPPSGHVAPQSMPVQHPTPGSGRKPGSSGGQASGGGFRLTLAGLGLAVLAVSGAILLVGPGGGNSAAPFGPIADAAERMQSYPGFEMDFSAKATAPSLGQSFTMSGNGVFNGKTGRARLSLRTAGAPGGDFQIDEVADRASVYMRSPAFSGLLPSGASWLKIAYDGQAGDESGLGVDPREQFEQLQAVSTNSQVIGPERIGHVVTTHYSATIDLQRQADQLRDQGDDANADAIEELISKGGPSSTPVNVWIDSKGLIRRMDMLMSFSAVGGPAATVAISVQISHLGIKPAIELPPDAQAFDASGLAGGGLSGLDS